MQILNFGSCNIDMVYSVDHILRPGETISALGISTFPGGKGLNQSVALARAGGKIYQAGCIGEDGGILLQCMHESGINTKYLRTVDDKTGHAIIQVDKNAENAIVIYGGANVCITKEHIDAVLEDFSAGDFLLIQNETSEVPYLSQTAAAKGLQVVLNPSPFNDRIKDIDIADISYLILNEVEAEGLWGTCDAHEIQPILQDSYPHLKIVLTLGKRGAVYFDKDVLIRQKAFRVESVDTTGAGDTFMGYFIACIAKGRSPKSAMRYASAASAITVSRKGASASIPWMKEVEEKLQVLEPCADTAISDTKNKILRFFEQHYSDATLNMLASELGYSTSYTSNWIKKTMNTTFTDLLQNTKCSIAAKYLEETSMPISDIIQKVGYKNESFFRKMFQQHYQLTPLKYRQRRTKEHGL